MLADRTIAILGAGVLGHGLAQVFAEAGTAVTIQDPSPEALATVRARVRGNLERLARDVEIADRIMPHDDLGDAVAGADWVIEAAPEDIELKRDLFARLDELAPAETILATNTSAIPVAQIAARTQRPERVLGTHWWNPPYLVPLVEVVQAEMTAPNVVERTLELLRAVGKTPVHVKRDVPGFVGNRLQHALWREAIALVADGVCDARTVDDVVKSSFGARLAVLGPLENADLVGLDRTQSIHGYIFPALNRSTEPSPYPHLL